MPVLDDRWQYDVDFKVEVSEPISAIEVRFIPFNIWGEKDRSLSTTEISDLGIGTHNLDATWRAFENDAVEHFASLAYVATIRLKSGKILHANPEKIVQAAREFSQDFTEGDLEEEKE